MESRLPAVRVATQTGSSPSWCTIRETRLPLGVDAIRQAWLRCRFMPSSGWGTTGVGLGPGFTTAPKKAIEGDEQSIARWQMCGDKGSTTEWKSNAAAAPATALTHMFTPPRIVCPVMIILH